MLTESPLDIERQKKAKEYARIMRRLIFAEWSIVAVVLLVLVFGRVSAKLSQVLLFGQPWASALYFVILAIGLGLILLPLSYYRGFVLSHRYGLSHEKSPIWLTDRAKASAVSLVLGLVIVIVVYWLLEHLPGTWWLWSGILLLLLGLLLTRLTPTLLISLFFKLEPIGDLELKRKLTDLAERARTKVCGIFTMNLSSKSTTANAMLAGLGKSRRIILSDTLLQKYSPEEIEVVLAHELGHHIHRDIPKMIVLQAAAAFLAFYLSDLVLNASSTLLAFNRLSDVATLPLLLLLLAAVNLVISPLTNAYSRYVEKAADLAALQLSVNPGAFITAMTKLADQNLTEYQPSRWVELLFYDHPPYNKRVDLARRYIQKTV
jgi:STE24 endopeptidase